MPEEVRQGWNVSGRANVVFIALLLALASAGILLSVVDLFGLPLLFEGGETLRSIESLPSPPGFSFEMTGSGLAGGTLQASGSPFDLNLSVETPPLHSGQTVRVFVVSQGRIVSETECMEPEDVSAGAFEGDTHLDCVVPLSYGYARSEPVKIYAVLADADGDAAGSAAYFMPLSVDWGGYEGAYWGSAGAIALFAALGLSAVLVAGLAMLYFASRIRHETEYAGEYSLASLLAPFGNAGTASQRFQAFIASPAFWAIEFFGILLLVAYLAVSFEAWKSPAAASAFILSGALAFVVPFLWTALFWFADYKEREPLRLVVSLFLWGGFACLMAVGINTVTGSLIASVGLGILAASATAPLFEEFFKGTGLAVFSLHHEYDGMVDGIVYGFAAGMGFSFVENWLYLLANPMGGDVYNWLFVFIARSILFSANHGVFTAMTGGIIGLLKQWRFPHATLGMGLGMLPAMFLHAVHNSGEVWVALFGGAGALAYCCVLLPVFDYGALALVIALLLAGVVMTQDRKKTPLEMPGPVKRLLKRGEGRGGAS